ncbi:ABC transporter substrate-binding protein, partial [Raoultella ornithinolytica]|uniref:ABC transporter substrate-binding protein n=1 Tax=Raoultella ornithinolytica TaxID=54291 RepID=UPI001F07EB62
MPQYIVAPGSFSEEVAYHHMYETLLRVSCDGRLMPGLAQSWAAAEGGRVWLFTLRPGARYWDGAPVTALAIIDQWQARRTPAGGTLWPGNSATAMDDGRLAVRVPRASEFPPRELADQSLAVYRRTRESLVPSGTGPYRPSQQPGSGLMLERVDSTPGPRIIEFLAAPGDARDLVDLGIDVL